MITKEKDLIVVYTLTPGGLKKLREVGVRSEQDFPSPRAFAALIRSGQAYSPRVVDAACQKQFGFERDETELHLPQCEKTGVTSDVRLVVYGDGSGTVAKLLRLEPRFVLQKVTQLGVPVTVLSLATVGQLETAQKLGWKAQPPARSVTGFAKIEKVRPRNCRKRTRAAKGCCRRDRTRASCLWVKGREGEIGEVGCRSSRNTMIAHIGFA